MKKIIIIAILSVFTSADIILADGPQVPGLKLSGGSNAKKKWSSYYVEADYTYTRHLGEYEKVWGSSQTATVTVGRKYASDFFMFLRTGYTKTEEWKNQKEGNWMIPILWGGKYSFDLNNFVPYFAFATGFNVISQKYDNFGGQTDDFLFKYSWQLGTGSYFFFTKNMALNAAVTYNSSFYYIDAQMTGFEYTGGLAFFFR